MILRRIISHVRTQNWVAVLLDFLIVVAGVFIGIQVSNANDAQGDRAFERELLVELRSDLDVDFGEFERAILVNNRRIAAVQYTIENAGDTEISIPNVVSPSTRRDDSSIQEVENPVDEAIRNRLWSTSLIAYFAKPSASSLEALLASGDFNRVSDKELLSLLQAYRQKLEALDTTQQTIFIDMRNNAAAIGLKYGLTPFDIVPEETFLELVGENKELLAALRAQAGLSSAHNQLVEAAQTAAYDLAAYLDGQE
ncbi:MAG: hypothetical protein AAF668_05435 [Pseudomonadota bacterium]